MSINASEYSPRNLGSGAFSTVVRAYNPQTEIIETKKVATDDRPLTRKFFENEFKALSRLKEAKIAGVPIPIGLENTRFGPVLRTEDLGVGKDIFNYSDWPRISPEEKINILKTVFDIWHQAAQVGVLNGDIRLDNFFLSVGFVKSPGEDYLETNGGLWIALIDWGNSKFKDEMNPEEWDYYKKQDILGFCQVLNSFFGHSDLVPPSIREFFKKDSLQEVESAFKKAIVEVKNPIHQQGARAYSKHETGKEFFPQGWDDRPELTQSLGMMGNYRTIGLEEKDFKNRAIISEP